MQGIFRSTITVSSLLLASAFMGDGVDGGTSGTCVQQKLDLSSLGSAILYTCGDNQSRGAKVGDTKVVNLEGFSPNGDEIALSAGPVIGYVANANNVQCAVGSSVSVLQVRNENGEWVDSGETIPPTLAFSEQCAGTVDLAGRWIEANSVYTDCGMEDFQCAWVVVPDEFYGSTGPYYIRSGDSVSCMVPDTYLPVCQPSNLERFNGFVEVRGDGLSIGVDGSVPSLRWYNNIATGKENRWVCSIPPGGAVDVAQTTPLSVFGSTRQLQSEGGATLYVCEGAGECSLEFTAPPVSNETDPMEGMPNITSTTMEGVKSESVGDAKSICQQMEVLSVGDSSIERNSSMYVLQGVPGTSAHAFCSDGSSASLPSMHGNPDWVSELLTETDEFVPVSRTKECKAPHFRLPPNFHPALSCNEEGFHLVGSTASGLDASVFSSNGVYVYGDNATIVSDKFNNLLALSNAECRERPRLTSGATGFGSWAQLKMIATATALWMTALAW